jgi:hypothetical protein
MEAKFWVAMAILAGFFCYVAVKVLAAMRKSERQWHQVDKSKLKTWDEDDDSGS